MVKKMEKKYYDCDAGSVLVECGGSFIHFDNGYGDGNFKVYLFDSKEEFDQYIEDHLKYGIEEKQYRYNTQALFKNAKVLDYDCLFRCNNDVLIEHTLFTLNGRYYIYYNDGKVYFVKGIEV